MKQATALVLALTLLLSCFAAVGEQESWICPVCGMYNTGNFCGRDGIPRPAPTATPEPIVFTDVTDEKYVRPIWNDGTVYRSPSDRDIWSTVSSGKELLLLATGGNWYKIREQESGVIAYVKDDEFVVVEKTKPSPALTPDPVPTPAPQLTPTPAAQQNNDRTVGNTVFFGTYPQTAEGNDDTPIEWIVLDVQGDKALLISRYALDCVEYNTTWTDVTWETCALRTWLNEDFYNKAFGATDKQYIVKSRAAADKNPFYDTDPGNDTKDNIFLLSITEVKKYFKDSASRRCAPTDYAVKKGAPTSGFYTADGRTCCRWWLRSPGNFSHNAAHVNYGGSVYYGGYDVNCSGNCVRPCVWVKLY